MVKILVGAASALVSLAIACGSSNGGGAASGGGGTVSCSQGLGSEETCIVYKGLDSDGATQAQNSCKEGSGTVGTSCPTTNILGCCTGTLGGITAETCYYPSGSDSGEGAPSVSDLQTTCTSVGMGVWTATQ